MERSEDRLWRRRRTEKRDIDVLRAEVILDVKPVRHCRGGGRGMGEDGV